MSINLGFSRNYLNMFRTLYNLPLGMNSKDIIKKYNEVKDYHTEIENKMQAIYYELKDSFNVTKFGIYLKEVGVFKHQGSYFTHISTYFTNRQGLRNRVWVANCEKILKAYESFKEIKK